MCWFGRIPLNQSHTKRSKRKVKIIQSCTPPPKRKKKHYSTFQLPISSLIYPFPTVVVEIRLTSSSAGSPLSRFLSHYFNIEVGNPATQQGANGRAREIGWILGGMDLVEVGIWYSSCCLLLLVLYWSLVPFGSSLVLATCFCFGTGLFQSNFIDKLLFPSWRSS